MIFGIGTDITEVKRFEKWVSDGEMIERFFNEAEKFAGDISIHKSAACQHYAARFAAKEAFSKALGTGIFGFDLKDIWIVKDEKGHPSFKFGESVKNALNSECGTTNIKVHVSLSHEKEYAISCVIIEIVK